MEVLRVEPHRGIKCRHCRPAARRCCLAGGILGSDGEIAHAQGNGAAPAGADAKSARADATDLSMPPYAVVLMYHRFGEDRYPATSLRTAQLEAHIAYLQDNDFNVLPLPEILDRFESGTALPPRTIAITVDDAYRSAYDVARPRFAAADMPWTLFVTTDQPDRGLQDFMSWDQIRELDADPDVTIGHHSGAHHHLPDYDSATNRHDTARASRRFDEELGHVPDLYAYPFGEYSNDVLSMIRSFGFRAAFGQHSGVAHAQAPRFELPRFALNENWGTMERFIERVHSKPLPVRDVTPSDSLVVRNNPPRLRFTVSDAAVQPAQIGCFPSGGIDARLEHDGASITVIPSAPFPPGRARINCTAPFGDGTHRWFGRQFVVRRPASGGHEPRPDPGAGTPAEGSH
jgi:poly-beta-1,6-N-acetyl-D-glucosamine N-deacetylase